MTTLSSVEYTLLTPEEYLRIHHLMTRARALNDKIEELREGTREIHGPALLSHGQEHIPLGAVFALEKLGIADSSWIAFSHRDQPILTWKGPDFEFGLIKNHLLKATSWSKGHDGNMHFVIPQDHSVPFSTSHMGANVGIAVGVAEALRDDEWLSIEDPKLRPVVLSFFGDGAAQQGVIHEAFNWAAVSNAEIGEGEWEKFEPFFDAINRETGRIHGAPIVFVMNNNEYAITTRARDQHGLSHLARRADGYRNMMGIDVVEKDPIAVYSAVCTGIRRAQKLEGSTLVVCHSYRLGGHNSSEDRSYMDQSELIVARAQDPVRVFASFLERLRAPESSQSDEETPLFSREKLEAIEQKNRDEIAEIAERALKEPDVTLPENRSAGLMFAPHTYIQQAPPSASNTKKLGYREAIVDALRTALRTDPRVTVFGEDVADPRGGILALTKGLSTEFGPRRVRQTPLSEAMIVSCGIGRAMKGLRPIYEMQFSPFVTPAMTMDGYIIPTLYCQNGLNLPLVQIMPFGVVGPGGSGNEHSHCNEAWFYHTQGWKIIFPSDAYEAKGLILAALEDPNPVMVYLQIYANTSSEFARDVPVEPYIIPIGKANIKRPGDKVTVVAYGANALQSAVNTAIVLDREHNFSMEVIDLRSIVPLDLDTIRDSVVKTERVIVIHEASKTGGVGESIAAQIIESSAYSHIRTIPPVTILAADDYPVPTAYALEWARLPFEEVPANKIDPDLDPDLDRLFSQKLYDAALALASH